MPRESRKRKAEVPAEAEAGTDSTAYCRGVLRNEARLKARISDLEQEVASLRKGPSDPDVVVSKLLESLHHSGDVGILRKALQPNAKPPRGKVRTLVLHDQAPILPTAMEAKEEKRAIKQVRAITRSPRKRAGSAYSSAASDAGEESAADTADDEKTESASMKSNK